MSSTAMNVLKIALLFCILVRGYFNIIESCRSANLLFQCLCDQVGQDLFG